MDPILLSLLLAAVGFLLYYTLPFVRATLRPANFPPGPPIIPGLGNLHQMPLARPYITYASWAKTYGPILGLKLGPNNIVILNRAEHVQELLVRRGAHYNARPKMHIPCEYGLGGNWERHIVFMSAEFQQRQRKAVRYSLGREGLEKIAPVQRAMASRLMHDLLCRPEDFMACFRHWAIATPLPMIGGQRVEDLGEGWSERYHHVQETWTELLEPGMTPPADIFPVLAWIPFTAWKKKAAFIRKSLSETYGGMLDYAKLKHNDKDPLPGTGSTGKEERPVSGRLESLLSRLLREQVEKPEELRFTENDLAFIGGGLLDAAVDTTLGSALFLLQALAAYPAVLQRVQAEVDEQCGRDSLPAHIDTSKFPYLKACLTEVLRWRPPTPQALPHECTADEDVFGYRIPKGSVVIINVWGIQHDSDNYSQPEQFNPERYLSDSLGLKQGAQDGDFARRKPLYTFGVGRRACPGEQFAFEALHMVFVQLLWAYDIQPDGELDLSTETGLHSGITLMPKPFKLKIQPRSKVSAQAVLDEYERANRQLADILP